MKITRANKRASYFFLIDSIIGVIVFTFTKGTPAFILGIIGFTLATIGWIYVIHYESKIQ